MKKIILVACSLFTFALCAQENKTWRLGGSFGLNWNNAKYTGGMQEANARFHQNDFATPGINFIGRYDHNTHWMAEFSLGFTSTGYEFALAENYSLLNKEKQFSTIQSDFGVIEIPVMVFYKFDPNCKNSRWIFGGGFVLTAIENKTVHKNFDVNNEGNNNSNYLTSTATSPGGAYALLRWSIAREKMFKNGSIFNVALLLNAGFSELSHTAVKYSVDNQDYEHNFSSNGNFVGLRFTYYLKPFARNTIK